MTVHEPNLGNRVRVCNRALELTRAIALDAACLRQKCEADHDLGYDLMKRFMPVLIQRLQTSRLQALDVYCARPLKPCA